MNRSPGDDLSRTPHPSSASKQKITTGHSPWSSYKHQPSTDLDTNEHHWNFTVAELISLVTVMSLALAATTWLPLQAVAGLIGIFTLAALIGFWLKPEWKIHFRVVLLGLLSFYFFTVIVLFLVK